jgi:dTDP-4-amino-4,6-dideoxygalactose transaminase
MSRSTEFIPFARPHLGPEEEEAVLRVLRSRWLTTGAETHALEEAYAARAGRKHAVAVSSATAGLHLTMEALDLPRGSLVAMSPYTFTASAEILRYLDMHPLFVDIDPENYQIDVDALARTLASQPKVSAIMAIHIAGLPGHMDALHEVARHYELALVEDAAHSLPKHGAVDVPHRDSAAAVFSLYATKPVAAGEGGIIVTDRDDLAERARTMRLHGIDRDVWRRYIDEKPGWMYDVVDAGYKYNLSDLHAAVARVQLDDAEARRARRAAIAERYTEAFADVECIGVPLHHPAHDWHLYMITLAPGPDGEPGTRDRFIREAAEAGVGTSVHYIPLHHFSYYAGRYNLSPEDFPRASRQYARTVSLPLYADLADEDVDRVIRTVRTLAEGIVRRSPRVAGE